MEASTRDLKAPFPGISRSWAIPALALVAVQIGFASGYPLTKDLLAEFDPLYWSTLRAFLTAFGFWFLCRRLDLSLEPRASYSKLFGLSLLGITLNQVFFALGLEHSTPTEAAFICTTIPVWIYATSLALRNERLEILKVLGIVVAISGVWFLFGRPQGQASLYNFANAAVYGLYVALAWREMRQHHPFVLMFWLFLFGAVSMLVASVALSAIGWTRTDSLAALGTGALWIRAFYLVAVGTVMTYACNAYAARRFPASVIGVAITSQPLLTALIERMFYGHAPDRQLLMSGILICGGVALTTLSRARLTARIACLALGVAAAWPVASTWAAPSSSQSFADFFFEYLERNELSRPAPGSYRMEARESPITEPLDDEAKTLKLYEKHLKSARITPRPTRWTRERIAAGFALPPSGVAQAFSNDSLIRAYAKDKKLIAVFRPISTTTGCQTGCLPVIFHLRLDSKGATLALLEDPERPLTKVNHAPLTEADRAMLLRTARDLPKALSWIDATTELADGRTEFPPSTWSALRSSLVPGAAYTSYRVYEAALSSRQALSRAEAPRLESARERVTELEGEWLRSSSTEELKSRLQALAKELSANTAPTPAQVASLRFAAPALAWLSARGALEASGLAGLIAALPPLRAERQAELMRLYRELLREPSTAGLVAEVLARPDMPCEPESLRPVYRSLAGAKSVTWSRETLLSEAVARDPALLSLALKRVRDKGEKALAIELEAERAANFPLLPESKAWLRSARKPDSPEQRALDSARARRRERIVRTALPDPQPFPSTLATATIKAEGSVAKPAHVALPVKSQEALLYVLFATWCPHCQETMLAWSKSFRPATWARIRMIEVYPGARTLPEFCAQTRLPSETCRAIVSLGDLDVDPRLKAQLGFEGVPHLLVVDKAGRIRFSGLRSTPKPGADPEEEILEYLAIADAD